MKWVCQRSPPRDSRQAPAERVVPYSFGIFHLCLPLSLQQPHLLCCKSFASALFKAPIAILLPNYAQNAAKQNFSCLSASALETQKPAKP